MQCLYVNAQASFDRKKDFYKLLSYIKFCTEANGLGDLEHVIKIIFSLSKHNIFCSKYEQYFK